jgi:hypothetical protein
MFARYVAPLAPFAALFAGHGAVILGRQLAPRHPSLGASLVIVVVAIAPAVHSARFVSLVMRDNTRTLAGKYIRAHVPPGTTVILPDLLGHANPVLPPGDLSLRMTYPEFREALLVARTRVDEHLPTYNLGYMPLRFPDRPSPVPPIGPYVVTATHPAIRVQTNPPPGYLAALAQAGAEPVATFQGLWGDASHSVYDVPDADYVPLDGFDAVLRPGPDITVWKLPASGSAH